VPGASRPICSGANGDAGRIELACGTTVRLSPRAITITPPPRTARAGPSGGSRAGEPRSGDLPCMTSGVRIRARYQGTVNVFDQLGEPLVEPLRADDPIRRCFTDLVDEIAGLRPGRCAMAEALLRRILVLVLRRCFERAGGSLAWAAGLDDTRLGRAVGAMREHPEHAFTLTELAEIAGMSRTVFAARFMEALAQPPIEFLKTLRLSRAARLLTRTDLPIKAIAGKVGYSSRSSFTRAFVACHGAAPQAFRAAPRPSGERGDS